jgi:hypothetical protein
MAQQRVAGIAYVAVDGKQHESSGEWTVNMGLPKRETKLGTARAAGYKEEPQVPMIEGKIILTRELSLSELVAIRGATVSLVAPNGDTFVLREAFFAGEGSYSTGEGEVGAKFEGASMELIKGTA